MSARHCRSSIAGSGSDAGSGQTQIVDCLCQLTAHLSEVFCCIQVRPHVVLYASPAYEQVWGQPLSALRKNPRSWMDAIVPEDRMSVALAVERLIRGEASLDHEYRIVRPDGSTRWIWGRGIPIMGGGRVEHVAGVAVDITERKNLEDQLRQAQKMEVVGRLAGGVAHDFNNLLGIIMGYSETALRSLASEDPVRSKIEQIRRAADRATAVTRQLLAYSRPQAVRANAVDLNDVLVDMEAMLRTLVEEDIDVVVTIASKTAWIHADRGEVEQIVMNLVVNARDAMPQGGRLTIRSHTVAAGEASESRGYVLLEIADTGAGIPEHVQARMFEPFFTTKDEGKGTGLGLSTVHTIVTRRRGRIFVHTVPGQGTRFRIYFPRAEAPGLAIAAQAALAVVGGGETILLVEDDEALRTVTADALEAQGHRVLAAADGGSALDVARGFGGRIDLMIADVILPGVSGADLARQLFAERPAMKVLYVSGHSPEAIDHHAVPERAPLLAKPFGPETLVRKVREVLSASSPGREPGDTP